MYDSKNTERERKLEHCDKQCQDYVELYHGAMYQNGLLDERLAKLKQVQRAAHLPLKDCIE